MSASPRRRGFGVSASFACLAAGTLAPSPAGWSVFWALGAGEGDVRLTITTVNGDLPTKVEVTNSSGKGLEL